MRRVSFLKALGCAVHGLGVAFRSERNVRIQCVIAMLVIGAGVVFDLNRNEWICIFIGIGVVFIVEMMNTAIEMMLDLLVPTHHKAVKHVKDISAGAVLVASVLAIVIGGMVFGSKLFNCGV